VSIMRNGRARQAAGEYDIIFKLEKP